MYSFDIFNQLILLQGQKVKEFTKPQGRYQVEDLNTGLYLLKISTNQGVLTKQLIKK